MIKGRTYTYTAGDYREMFGSGSQGKVGVDPDGDLVWVSAGDQIVWAHETIVLNHLDLASYKPSDVIYAPSAMMKAEFDARQD